MAGSEFDSIIEASGMKRDGVHFDADDIEAGAQKMAKIAKGTKTAKQIARAQRRRGWRIALLTGIGGAVAWVALVIATAYLAHIAAVVFEYTVGALWRFGWSGYPF